MIKTEKSISSLRSYRGVMKKRLVDMTFTEKQAYYKSMALKVKENLFSVNQPLIYRKNTKIVAEFANGEIKEIR